LLTAWWPLEEDGTDTRVASGACGSACDLAPGTPIARATPAQEGSFAADLVDATDNTLSCAEGTCTSLADPGDANRSWGGWVRPSSSSVLGATNTDRLLLSALGGGSAGYGVFFETDSGGDNTVICAGGGTVAPDSIYANTFAVDTWTHVGCVFDAGADTIQAYVDGVAYGSPVLAGPMTSAAKFQLGEATSGNFGVFPGLYDEWFVDERAFSAAEMCRLCSCGIRGEQCLCDGGDPTQYVDSGRNATACNSCTLPACDTPAP